MGKKKKNKKSQNKNIKKNNSEQKKVSPQTNKNQGTTLNVAQIEKPRKKNNSTPTPASITAGAAIKPTTNKNNQTELNNKFKQKLQAIKTSFAQFFLPIKNFWPHLKKFLLKAFTVFIGVTALSVILITIELISNARTMPNLTMASLDLGYQNIDDVEAKLKNNFANFLSSPITFEFLLDGGGVQTVAVTPAELGVKYSIEKSLENIPRFDFKKDLFISLLISKFAPRHLQPSYTFDQKQAISFLENKFKLSEKRAQDASLFANAKKNIEIKPEKSGKILDYSNLILALQNDFSNLDSQKITLQLLDENPQITQVQLQKDKDKMIALLKPSIYVLYKQKKWRLDMLNHLESVKFIVNSDNSAEKNQNSATSQKESQTSILIDYPKLAPFVEKEIFNSLEKPTSDIKISKGKDGKIIFDGYAENGVNVDKVKFSNDLAAAINLGKKEIQITTSETVAKIETSEELQQLGIKSLLGIGHTAFAGSPNARQHNIHTGIEKFNGLIVKPGETFSFNDNLGEVDGSTGYMKELVIKGANTVPEYGGGVCQVSSTAYKAALFSGLPIQERENHSYAVGYYAQIDGYGLDSTIYPGVVDLKFINDTPGDILIQSYVKGTEAFFKFYGTDDGRKVKMDGPHQSNYRAAGGTVTIPTTTLPAGAKKQVESAHPGFDMTWYRYLTDKNGIEKKEQIFSSYRATSNRFLVGAGG